MKTKIPNLKLLIFTAALFFGIFVLAKSSLSAANNFHYIRDGGTGDCSDWANACDDLPANLNRGDTYYLADGNYGSHNFNDPVSGGQYITIKKATLADHGTDFGWDLSYATNQAQFGGVGFDTDNYIFDGITGGGPGQWESGFGFKIKSGGKNIFFNGQRQNITIRHVEMENNGRYTKNDNEDSIYGTGGIQNILISHTYIHDVSRCQLLTRDANGIILEYSKLARNGPVSFDGIHREAWSASTDDNITIRYNIFEDISNTGFIALVNGWGDAENWKIYGNVFWHTGELSDDAAGTIIATRYDPDPSPIHRIRAVNWNINNNSVINNNGTSVIGIGGGLADAAVNVNILNNMWFNNTGNATGIWGVTNHDYNWFFNNYRIEGCNPSCNLDNQKIGSEPNVIIGTGNPFIDWQNGDFRLKYAILGLPLDSPYNQDLIGITRGSDGVFDRGAYEFVSDTAMPAAPGGLSVN